MRSGRGDDPQPGPMTAARSARPPDIDRDNTYRIAVELDELGVPRFNVQQWGWLDTEQLRKLATDTVRMVAFASVRAEELNA